MVTEAVIWSIFLLPLGSFAFSALVVRPFFDRYSLISGIATIGALATALAFSIWTLSSVILGHDLDFQPVEWLDVGGASIEMGLLVDPLTAVMLVVVTSVSLLVQIYSLAYMKGDQSFTRYYAYMSLFTASMLGLVLAVNIIQLYVFWELVGVSSYLLIGFWHERPLAAAAAKKAFIITRIGDVGFLIAILYLFTRADDFAAAGMNAFHIPDIWQAAQPAAAAGGILGGAVLTWLALGIFAGAVGKSGQFPLHAWLPDAMEGPTPVSALIHAATMVAAGVFLVARFYPVFVNSADAMIVVALAGAFTAIMAASMALVMNDIKRVMAYSTISQLGYMMAALGLGLYAAAIFHLATHAAFKALLFMGAGSVNHATGTFDMRYMGGLRRTMPITYILVLVAGLSLVGIIPLAGFWSKDEILTGAWNNLVSADGTWVGRATFSALLAGVIVTAFYTIRLIVLTFHGEFRGGVERELMEKSQAAPAGASGHGGVHLQESPFLMVLPMVALGVAAVVLGYLANPQWIDQLGIPKHWISGFLTDGLASDLGGFAGHLETQEFSWWMTLVSTGAALSGIGLALVVYLRKKGQGTDPLERVKPVHTLLSQKYYIDTLYEDVLVRKGFFRVIAGTLDWIDRNLVDGIVDLIGWFFRSIGTAIGKFQTGQVQAYATGITFGILALILALLLA